MAIKTKDVGLRLRVESELRQAFVDSCRADGRTAAQVLRECMRQYVERARAGQQDLFATKGGQSAPKTTSPRAHAKQRRGRGSRSKP
jgi:hypothetical protein